MHKWLEEEFENLLFCVTRLGKRFLNIMDSFFTTPEGCINRILKDESAARPVVETAAGNGMSYSSLNFTNKNNAPARLFVSVYRNGNNILGHFNEGSYVPVVPYLQLKCQQF
jgi:hypothetical protein